MTRFIGMWFHWAAIVLLVGGPLAAFLGATEGLASIVIAFFIGFFALLVAEIHAGLFDDFSWPYL